MVQIVYIIILEATYECFFISHIPNHVPIVAPKKKLNIFQYQINMFAAHKKKQVSLNAPSLSVGKLQDF